MNSWWHIYLGIGLGAAVLSALLTALVRRLAPRLGFLDRPRSEAHKQHAHVVPTLGGIAMFVAWLAIIGGVLVIMTLLWVNLADKIFKGGMHVYAS